MTQLEALCSVCESRLHNAIVTLSRSVIMYSAEIIIKNQKTLTSILFFWCIYFECVREQTAGVYFPYSMHNKTLHLSGLGQY